MCLQIKKKQKHQKHYYPNGRQLTRITNLVFKIFWGKFAQNYTWNRTLSLWLAKCDKQRQERERNGVWFWCILKKMIEKREEKSLDLNEIRLKKRYNWKISMQSLSLNKVHRKERDCWSWRRSVMFILAVSNKNCHFWLGYGVQRIGAIWAKILQQFGIIYRRY